MRPICGLSQQRNERIMKIYAAEGKVPGTFHLADKGRDHFVLSINLPLFFFFLKFLINPQYLCLNGNAYICKTKLLNLKNKKHWRTKVSLLQWGQWNSPEADWGEKKAGFFHIKASCWRPHWGPQNRHKKCMSPFQLFWGHGIF